MTTTAVLGTGMVGRAHAAKLAALGHDVALGTQDVPRTLHADDRTVADWLAQHPGVRLATFRDAVADADLVLAALNGQVAVEVLEGLADALAGRTLIDIGNPLDFSSGHLELFVKTAATALVHAYGWRSVIDLGPLTAARGMEMMLPMWLNLMNALGTAEFGYRVIT